MSAQRRPNMIRYFGVAMLVGALVGAISGVSVYLAEVSGASEMTLAAIDGALLMVGLLAGLAFCGRYWFRLDEAVREAHKSAWWWGASGGLAVAGVLSRILPRADLGLPTLTSGEPGQLIVLGGVLTALLQTAGYAIAWGVWWLRKR